MASIQIQLDEQEEQKIFLLQQQLPKNRYGHNFSKTSICKFFILEGLTEETTKNKLLKKYGGKK